MSKISAIKHAQEVIGHTQAAITLLEEVTPQLSRKAVKPLEDAQHALQEALKEIASSLSLARGE